MLATMQPEERGRPSPLNLEFRDVVRRLLGGMSPVAAFEATGVSHTHIQGMRRGTVPGYRTLVRFADGLNVTDADRLELFRAAGYVDRAVVEEALRSGAYDGRAYYTDRMRDLAERYGPRYARVSLDKVPDQDTPREVVDLIISTVEEDIKREIASTQEGIDSGKP